jgi:hypothetical protein
LTSLQGLKVEETETFSKCLKKLQKRFKNIQKDCDKFIEGIDTVDSLGTSLGNGIYKVRIANSDKKSGKSAGYRLVSYLKLTDSELYLMYIYDKSDTDNISEKQIDELFQKFALQNP